MEDIETAITGKTVEQNLLENNVPIEELLRKPLNGNLPIEIEQQRVGDNYERLKKAEVKTNWLRQEGTVNFIIEIEKIRLEKLIEAENYAKMGQSEASIRLLLKCAALRETIEIIKEI